MHEEGCVPQVLFPEVTKSLRFSNDKSDGYPECNFVLCVRCVITKKA